MKIQRRLVYGMASLTLLYAGAGQALGLGELQLQSALSQPLQAVIKLHDSEGLRPSDVLVTLADGEAFARAGLDRPHFLTGLRFTPMMDGQQLVIRVETEGPVREPYLNFLVQLTRPNGSLLREYTLLLDPPLYQPVPVMVSSAAQVDVTPQRAEVKPVRSASLSSPQTREPAVPTAAPQPGTGRYQTVSGDSLWTIARATRADDRITLQQHMDAITALNPHAFVNGDPGRLRVGQELTLPDTSRDADNSLVASAPRTLETAPAESFPAEPAPARQAGRLVIEDSFEQVLSEEEEQLHERLNIVEKRLRGLLDELEVRDAEIASLQTQLEMLRQTPAVEQQAEPEVRSPVPEADQAGTPDAIETTADREERSEQDEGWVMRWWSALLALLAAWFGALLLRRRREPEQQELPQVRVAPAPQPITIPGSRVVDPLEGVELYLAYGRLSEAQLMLDKAIAAEPQRIDLRMRLLAVLAELGDAQGFVAQEQELHALGADHAQIDQLKESYPQLDQMRQSASVDPS